ncbi:MAG: metallophosphoesterase [Myxococcota bacterium]
MSRWIVTLLIGCVAWGCGGPEQQKRAIEPEIESTIRVPVKARSTLSERVTDDRAAVKPTLAQPRPVSATPVVAHAEADAPAPPVTPDGPEVYSSWPDYQLEHRYDCAGRLDTLEPPFEFSVGKDAGRIFGHRMEVTLGRSDTPKSIRIGVLSGPKDTSEATQENLEFFLDWFGKQRVDVVVVNGDVGYTPEEFEETMTLLGKSGYITVVSAGNADMNVPFNRAARDVSAVYPNLVNGNLVRLVDVGPVSLLVLPGYHDAMFVSPGDGCQYYREDLDDHATLAKRGKGKPVLVAHGPPRGMNEDALDFAFDAGNVGDTALNRFIDEQGVHLGIFGHILEAGGRAVNPATGRAARAGKWSKELWINAGCSTSLVTQLHDGTKHGGMAAVVETDGVRARYWLSRRAAKN